ncbi:hypothetical protein AOLI_G00127750 [Acnodon oligacanthus]
MTSQAILPQPLAEGQVVCTQTPKGYDLLGTMKETLVCEVLASPAPCCLFTPAGLIMSSAECCLQCTHLD